MPMSSGVLWPYMPVPAVATTVPPVMLTAAPSLSYLPDPMPAPPSPCVIAVTRPPEMEIWEISAFATDRWLSLEPPMAAA